jgi:ribosomal protein S18 acetylase RimI-like enzyme
VGWLERSTRDPVTLLVDGENDNALGLYRSEGFEVTKSRRIWAQPRETA